MKRVAGILAAAAIATAVGARNLGPPARDTWALVGVNHDLSLVWAWYEVTNTELVDKQLTTRLLLVSPGSSPTEHRALGGTATAGDAGVASGTDGLERTADGWQARIGGEGLAARINLRGAAAGCPPEAGSMAGMVEDRTWGMLVDGVGVVTRIRSVGTDPALYVVGPGFAAGLDPLSDCAAWVSAGGATWAGEAPRFVDRVGGGARLGDWQLRIRSVGAEVDQDPFGHLLGPERWIAARLGVAPVLRARRALVRVEGPGVGGVHVGLLLSRG